MNQSLDINEVIQIYDTETATDVLYKIKLSISPQNERKIDDADFYFHLPLDKKEIDSDIISILDYSIKFIKKKVESFPDGHTNSSKFVIPKTNLYVMIVDGDKASYSFLLYILIKFTNILNDRIQK